MIRSMSKNQRDEISRMLDATLRIREECPLLALHHIEIFLRVAEATELSNADLVEESGFSKSVVSRAAAVLGSRGGRGVPALKWIITDFSPTSARERVHRLSRKGESLADEIRDILAGRD